MEELEQNIKMFSDDSLELRDKLKGLGEGAPDHMRETYMLLLKNLAALREEKNILLLRQGGKTGSIDINFCIVLDPGVCRAGEMSAGEMSSSLRASIHLPNAVFSLG